MILAMQGTMEFNFARRSAIDGLGVLSDHWTPGFLAHPTLAMSMDGVPLGILEQPSKVHAESASTPSLKKRVLSGYKG